MDFISSGWLETDERRELVDVKIIALGPHNSAVNTSNLKPRTMQIMDTNNNTTLYK